MINFRGGKIMPKDKIKSVWDMTEDQKIYFIFELVDWLREDVGSFSAMKGLIELGYSIEILSHFFDKEEIEQNRKYLEEFMS